MRARSWTAIAVGVAALAVTLACGAGTTSTGSGSQPAGSGAPSGAAQSGVATVKLGEPVNIKSLGNEYTVTVSNLRIGQKGKYSQPKKGQFIVVDVKVEVTAGQQYASAGMLKLVLPSGEVFEEAFADIDGVDTTWGVQLNAGQNKAGSVVFDVPKDLAGAQVYVQEFDKPAGYWAL